MPRKGDARYRELSARFLASASTMGADLSEADIRRTIEIARQLSDEPKGISDHLRRRTLAASAKGQVLTFRDYHLFMIFRCRADICCTTRFDDICRKSSQNFSPAGVTSPFVARAIPTDCVSVVSVSGR